MTDAHQIETDYFKHRNIMNRDCDWLATLDCYDGAPDTPQGIFTAQGTGKTEMEAIEDLIDSLDGEEIYLDLYAIGFTGECDPYDYREFIAKAKAKDAQAKADIYAEDNRAERKQY